MFRLRRDDDSVSSSDDDENETIDFVEDDDEDDDSPPPLIRWGVSTVSTVSDALSENNDLEQELRALKQQLILAEESSKFHQERCEELEQQLLSSKKCANGQDAPQRQGSNKHVCKESG